jgi:signal transduction histidine kinase
VGAWVFEQATPAPLAARTIVRAGDRVSVALPEAPPYGVRKTIRIIVAVIGILIVMMWAAVGLSIVASRQAALDDAHLEGRNLMIAFREEIALILREVEGETNLIAERMRRERGSFDLYAWGQEHVLVSPGMAEAAIIDPDGELTQATTEPHPISRDLSNREHFRVHLDGRFQGLYIGQTLISRTSGVPNLPISRRVEADDGTFLGVLVILLSPSALTTLHKEIDLGPHGVLTLSGIDHVIRARFSADSPGGTNSMGGTIGGGREAVDEENAEGWYRRASAIDGIPRLFVYGRVGSYPLIVTVGLDQHQALAGWHSQAAAIVIMALAASLMLIGFAAYLIRETFRDVARASNLMSEIRERSAAQGLLSQSTAELRRSNQELDSFAYAASHDLKAPLRGIRNLTEWIAEDVKDKASADTTENLVLLRSRVDRLDMLLDSLLQHSRVGRVGAAPEDIDIDQLIHEIADYIAARNGFSVTYGGEIPVIHTSKAPLEQVLRNLIGNAIKHHDGDAGTVVVTTRDLGNEIEFRVEDDGAGIPTQFHERIFQMFQTLKSRDDLEGSGMGLAIVKKSVEGHGGTIRVESAPPHRGTAFIFTWEKDRQALAA